jgi:hypothetical protein
MQIFILLKDFELQKKMFAWLKEYNWLLDPRWRQKKVAFRLRKMAGMFNMVNILNIRVISIKCKKLKEQIYHFLKFPHNATSFSTSSLSFYYDLFLSLNEQKRYKNKCIHNERIRSKLFTF